MSAPPIPSFEPYSCPNCGLPLREPVEFCPACGARLENLRRMPSLLNFLIILGLASMMVPLGLAGACFLIVAPFNGFNWASLGFGAFGLVLCIAAVLCGIGIKKLNKK